MMRKRRGVLFLRRSDVRVWRARVRRLLKRGMIMMMMMIFPRLGMMISRHLRNRLLHLAIATSMTMDAVHKRQSQEQKH